MIPATIPFQPRQPVPISLQVLHELTTTIITRGWRSRDAAACRLCALCSTASVGPDFAVCTISVDGYVSGKDAAGFGGRAIEFPPIDLALDRCPALIPAHALRPGSMGRSHWYNPQPWPRHAASSSSELMPSAGPCRSDFSARSDDLLRSTTMIPRHASAMASTANADRSMPRRAAAAAQRACSSTPTSMDAFTDLPDGGTAGFRFRGTSALSITSDTIESRPAES